ncbi:hypothetical protein [Streptomyces asiaticus]
MTIKSWVGWDVVPSDCRGSIVSAAEGIGDLGVPARADGDIVALPEPKIASFDFGDDDLDLSTLPELGRDRCPESRGRRR